MTPERKIIINGKLIEEYYWNGRLVVYVDNQRSDRSYYEECRKIEAEVK